MEAYIAITLAGSFLLYFSTTLWAVFTGVPIPSYEWRVPGMTGHPALCWYAWPA
jgi:hypothetical protein